MEEKAREAAELAAEKAAEAAAGPAEAAASEAEPMPEVEKLKLELADQQAKFLYLQAEYQNFRKRAARDLGDARSQAVAGTLMPFLNVADYLAMAGAAAAQSDNLEALRQGLGMIVAEFDKALDEMGVRKFSAVGEKFDPALHDAVRREPSETVPEGVVVSEWNCGYRIGEKLLRPARVTVSSGRPETEAAESEA